MSEPAMLVATQVRPSAIFGKGLFVVEPIPLGKIVCFFPIGARVITEERFLAAVEAGEWPIIRTGTRYAGRFFTIGNEEAPYTYLNHSFEPNLLCHCGIVLARRTIAVDEEMTLDYRTLIDDTPIGVYNDASSGREIRGFSAKETALRTAREFAEIVGAVKDWSG